MAPDIDQRVRMAAFKWLEEQTALHDAVLPRGLLAQGFLFDGQRVPLLGPQGIFKPAILPEIPLSITTVLRRRLVAQRDTRGRRSARSVAR